MANVSGISCLFNWGPRERSGSLSHRCHRTLPSRWTMWAVASHLGAGADSGLHLLVPGVSDPQRDAPCPPWGPEVWAPSSAHFQGNGCFALTSQPARPRTPGAAAHPVLSPRNRTLIQIYLLVLENS